jgi:hypothetical protein
MVEKFDFYDQHGVEEYYVYDPDDGSLEGWLRGASGLVAISDMRGFISPRLGITFEPGEGPNNLTIIRPDGEAFLRIKALFKDRAAQRQLAEDERRRADLERQRAEDALQREEDARRREDLERQRAEDARQREEAARQLAEDARRLADVERQRAEDARQREEDSRQRADRLAARLRELGIDPE